MRFETNGTVPLAVLPLTGLDWTIPTMPPILQPTLNASGDDDDGGDDKGTLGSTGEVTPKGQNSGKDVGDCGWMPPMDS
jgi:hypothetical protein